MPDYFSAKEAKNKLENYCAYQERCHDEVLQKLRSMTLDHGVADAIILSLLADNYLNETRFACSFARGKHRIKHWGKIRIVNELKARHISKYNIDTALKEITPEDYLATFHSLAETHWENMREGNLLKKRKKFCDFLLRKGYESNLVYDKVKELESSTSSD